MRPASLLRSTPFRLALAFALLFVCAFLLSGLIAFDLIRKELNVRNDSRIRETYRIISQTYADSDAQDLVESTKAHIASVPDRQNIFLLLGPDGRALAGNIPATALPDGWSEKTASAIGVSGTHRYRLFAGTVGVYRLVVGTDDKEIRELEEIVTASFAWASIVVLAIALGGGAFIALRAQRRLDAVRETMARVSHGELAARIPLLGRGDDLDHLSRGINEALERLSASVEQMRQVSTDIAHDLKTPLNHLRITLESSKAKLEQGRCVTEEVDRALDEVDQINATFEALLRIARIESGARKSRFAEVSLSGVFRTLVEVYGSVAEEAGQTLKEGFEADRTFAICGDRELLTQMYANLIENAIRHCPRGTSIRLTLRAEHGQTITGVEDNGPGIPPQDNEKIFRRLYRLEKSRTSPGTGLGMSLVKAVVDLHGATIRLEDARPGLRVIICYAA